MSHDSALIASADCYAAGERPAMERGQQLRQILLEPGLRVLTALGVGPTALSMASLVAGCAFAAAWSWSPRVALILLAGHVVLDGIDGPLARWQRRNSPRGSLTDTACDHCVMTTVGLTLMANGLLSPVAGASFLVLYTLVLAFAMVRNAMRIPYHWLVRPRFLLYAAIPVELWLLPGVLTPLAVALSGLLLLKAVTGFLAIRRQLPQQGH